MRRGKAVLVVLVGVIALVVAGCSAGNAAAVTTVTSVVTVPPPTTTSPSTADPGTAQSPTPAPAASTPAVKTTLHSSPKPKPPPTTTAPPAKPVHASFFQGDGQTYGVGIAIMVLFNVAPTDPTAFEHAAQVTVNGKAADGAWFWQSAATPGYVSEALYREQKYWPAHARIQVELPIAGLSAGRGLAYDDNLSLNIATGAAHISTVDNATHIMTVTSDGKVVKKMPVSLGYADTPTYDGTKVIMAKNNPVRMVSAPGDPHPYNLLVPWSLRITNSGEFIHAASWNTGNIGSRNTSHGCTNLDPNDAEWFYNFSSLGDVVLYPNANPKGQVQPSWDGWGWWNVSWPVWQAGGQLHTTR